MTIYVLNETNTVALHGIEHMQVILIIITIKLSSRVALVWDVHKLFLIR